MYDDMSLSTFSRRRYLRRSLLVCTGLFICGSLWREWHNRDASPGAIINHEARPSPKAFVVASTRNDDVSWLQDYLSDWSVYRYVADDASAKLTVPRNKGREAMVYLTFMIDFYDQLPDITVFIHSGRYQWHNDDPLYDGVAMLRNLQLPYLNSQGYTSIRCVWTLGCPSEIKLHENGAADTADVKSTKETQAAYAQAFQELFPEMVVPEIVGVTCCAQFALAREKIRQRPRADYERYRQWLIDTSLDDSVSGRILEYSWHIIFGRPYVHCPNAKECYCNVFGLCNLDCRGDEKCGERWPFPPFATLPTGWPTVGWDGETRSQEALANMRNVAVTTGNERLTGGKVLVFG